MDWTLILPTYPKGMDAFCQHKLGANVDKCMGTTEQQQAKFWAALSLINDRELYDFFDSHGLLIFLKQGTHDGYLDFDIENRNKDFDKESKLTWSEVETDRKGIEDIAFMKAWELLELIL